MRSGLTLEQTLGALPLDESFLPPPDSPLGALRPIMQGIHRWNVKKTWLELKDEIAPGVSKAGEARGKPVSSW